MALKKFILFTTFNPLQCFMKEERRRLNQCKVFVYFLLCGHLVLLIMLIQTLVIFIEIAQHRRVLPLNSQEVSQVQWTFVKKSLCQPP